MQGEHDPPVSITEQGALWWVTLHGNGASAAEHREFAEWVVRSPERVEAYLHAARVQRALRSSSIEWPDTPVEVLLREARAAPPEPFPMPVAHVVTVPANPDRAARAWLRSAVGLAAAVLIGIGLVYQKLIFARPQVPPQS